MIESMLFLVAVITVGFIIAKAPMLWGKKEGK